MDERLRDLERRWRSSVTLEDEVVLLQERVRGGVLARPRLRLAAALGHRAAWEVLLRVGERPEPPAEEPDLAAMADLLRPACAEIQTGVRAGLALFRLALSLLTGPQSSPWIESLSRPARVTAEEWARCPCEAHARAAWVVATNVEAAHDAADEAARITTNGDWWSGQAVQAAHFLPAAIALAAGLPQPVPSDPLGPDPTALLVGVCEEFMVLPSHLPRTYEQARAALLDQLVPWLLGHADPLAPGA